MRHLIILTLPLATTGCAWSGQGPHPARYPWDQPQWHSSYCVMSLEVPSSSGITVRGGKPVELACTPPKMPGRPRIL
jgi:hypothetical protein